jgi:hypothetical protein
MASLKHDGDRNRWGSTHTAKQDRKKEAGKRGNGKRRNNDKITYIHACSQKGGMPCPLPSHTHM